MNHAYKHLLDAASEGRTADLIKEIDDLPEEEVRQLLIGLISLNAWFMDNGVVTWKDVARAGIAMVQHALDQAEQYGGPNGTGD